MAASFTKATGPKPGSAVKAAGKLYGSCHTHAVRYGDKTSKEYRQAFGQHLGRFISLVRRHGRTDS